MSVFFMAYSILTNQWELTPEMERLQTEKKAALKIKERKYDDWDDNYGLYRNKVKTNRLTQRQAVNIPLMKETIKTTLSKVDEAPKVEQKELGGDEQKEIFYQEVWNDHYKRNKLEIIDVLDKKNVLLYGYGVKKLNIDDNGVVPSVLDVYDIVLDPLMNSWDLESARFIIHQNIFRNVRDILADNRYEQKGKDELKLWADSPAGIVQGAKNKEEWEKKMERLKTMGVGNDEFGYFAGGDVVVNLTEHYSKTWNVKKKEFERRVIVYAEDRIELLNERLIDLIGVDFWPFVYWCEDPETNDIYPDSIADLVRTPNKVLNVWFSQMIENRTLKNFQMHWFLPSQGYTPQTYTPGPGVMLPAPPGDDINKVIRPVEISGLDDTFAAIQVLTQIVERGTGATAIEKGQPEEGQQTLGEIQILVGKAVERTIAMAKFYNLAWYEYAKKWNELMEVNAPKVLKLFKIDKNGKTHQKTILKSDWLSEAGYEPVVSSSSEQEAESTKGIQKFMFILSQFPNNLALRKIAQKRMLELVDLNSAELKEVEEGEKQAQMMMAPQEQENQTPQLMSEIQNKMAQLQV